MLHDATCTIFTPHQRPALFNVFSMLLDLFHICLLHIFLASNFNLIRIVLKIDKFITFDLEKEKNDDGYMKFCLFMPFAGIAKCLTAIYFHSEIGTMHDEKMIIFSQNRDENKNIIIHEVHEQIIRTLVTLASTTGAVIIHSIHVSVVFCSLLFHNHKHMCISHHMCISMCAIEFQ